MKFHLSHKEGVIQQIRILQERAKEADIEASYVAALKQVIHARGYRPLLSRWFSERTFLD